jgi:hypothetical protein
LPARFRSLIEGPGVSLTTGGSEVFYMREFVCSRRDCDLNKMEFGKYKKQRKKLLEPPLQNEALGTSLHVKGLSLIDRRFVPHRRLLPRF